MHAQEATSMQHYAKYEALTKHMHQYATLQVRMKNYAKVLKKIGKCREMYPKKAKQYKIVGTYSKVCKSE